MDKCDGDDLPKTGEMDQEVDPRDRVWFADLKDSINENGLLMA